MEMYRFKLLLPQPNACGNLLWSYPENEQEEKELHALFERIRATGIWCSRYPEGDGFCFTPDSKGSIDEAMLTPEYYMHTVALFKQVFGDSLFIEPNLIYLFIVVLQDARDNITHLQSQLATIHNRDRKDYFTECNTVVEVKTRYLQLADEYNFYRGGDAKTMERIQDEYEKACNPILLYSDLSEGDFMEQHERARCYVEIISILLVLTGVKIEVERGCLWAICSVYQSERELREVGFRYLPSKQAWGYPL